MANETRRLLKIFGVAVTDFEAEAEKLQVAVCWFSVNWKNRLVELASKG